MESLLGSMPVWLVQLATEAIEVEETIEEAVEESGIGLEQILDSNVLNIVVVLGLLVYLSRNVVGDILAQRRSQIAEELQNVSERKRGAEEQLADQQQKLTQAQQEAQRIKQEAEANAETLREELLAQLERDIERIRAGAEREVSSEQERVADELRRQIVREALAKVETELPQRLDPTRQTQLIDQCIQKIGG